MRWYVGVDQVWDSTRLLNFLSRLAHFQIFPPEEPQPVQQPPRPVPAGHLWHSHADRGQPQLQLPAVSAWLRGRHGQVSKWKIKNVSGRASRTVASGRRRRLGSVEPVNRVLKSSSWVSTVHHGHMVESPSGKHVTSQRLAGDFRHISKQQHMCVSSVAPVSDILPQSVCSLFVWGVRRVIQVHSYRKAFKLRCYRHFVFVLSYLMSCNYSVFPGFCFLIVTVSLNNFEK